MPVAFEEMCFLFRTFVKWGAKVNVHVMFCSVDQSDDLTVNYKAVPRKDGIMRTRMMPSADNIKQNLDEPEKPEIAIDVHSLSLTRGPGI